MKGQMTDTLRIRHILDAINEVEHYLNKVSYEEYLLNSEKRFATIKQVEIIGEACNNISQALKDAHPEIEWRLINGFRNISIHEYFAVNFHIVWEIVQNDIPVLKLSFLKILAGHST